MMNYYYMMPGHVGGMFVFAWLTYILLIVLLVLSIIALRKYINKK